MSKVANGGRYRNTFDRAGSYYAASVAPARKDPGEASVREVMLRVYRAFSNDSEKIGLKTVPDMSLTTWEPVNPRKDDVKKIRDAFDKIGRFIHELFDFVRASEATIDGLRARKEDYTASGLFIRAFETAGMKITSEEDTTLYLDSVDSILALFDEIMAKAPQFNDSESRRRKNVSTIFAKNSN